MTTGGVKALAFKDKISLFLFILRLLQFDLSPRTRFHIAFDNILPLIAEKKTCTDTLYLVEFSPYLGFDDAAGFVLMGPISRRFMKSKQLEILSNFQIMSEN